jgi:hypothetical protein
MRPAHRDEVVPAVSAWSDGEIVRVLDRFAGFDDRLGRQRGAVAADQHDAIESIREVGLEGISQSVGESGTHLFEQARLSWQDGFQRSRGAARVDNRGAFPTKLEAKLHRVEQEPAIQIGRPVRSERRHQPRLCASWLGRLADDDERPPHLAGSVTLASRCRANESFMVWRLRCAVRDNQATLWPNDRPPRR